MATLIVMEIAILITYHAVTTQILIVWKWEENADHTAAVTQHKNAVRLDKFA